MRSIVRANLKSGNDFGIALQGCLEAAWPKNVPVPSRGPRKLVGGEKLSFPPGVIHPHETLTCVSNRVKAVVPPAGRTILGYADGSTIQPSSASRRELTEPSSPVAAEAACGAAGAVDEHVGVARGFM